jgi:hypothetical protein
MGFRRSVAILERPARQVMAAPRAHLLSRQEVPRARPVEWSV